MHHVGGYAPFACELEPAGRTAVEVVVRAVDPAADLTAPRGKQDWEDEPHGIWYPRTTGIWKTVWIEQVPATRIADVRWSADVTTMQLELEAAVDGAVDGDRLRVHVGIGTRVLVDDDVAVVDGRVRRTFTIGDGGFDDRHGLLWWPSRPTLLDAELTVTRGDAVIDRVDSYTALRTVRCRRGRFELNGRPFQLRMVLDQGYWPATGATPPGPDALRQDIELTKRCGFNTVRKHQKTEDPRYLALADQLGLMVWVEMPSAYRAGPSTSAALLREWTEVIAHHRNHPSVVAWVPINESWGADDCAVTRSSRATIEAMHHTTVALDGTRPVSANDGWETVAGDIVGVHDYDQDRHALAARWGSPASIDRVLGGRRPDGRSADLDGAPAAGRAVVLSEFGGVALADDTGTVTFSTEGWGYDDVGGSDAFVSRYRTLWSVVHASTGLAGACWTQLTDTYQEVNGLLRADRSPKVDLEAIRAITTGRDTEPATAPHAGPDASPPEAVPARPPERGVRMAVHDTPPAIGITLFPTDRSIPPAELAREIEGRGFESFWLPEHSHIPASRESPWPGSPDGSAPLPDMYWHLNDQIVAARRWRPP